MSSDRRDEYYLRGRARYVREHAHLVIQTAALCDMEPSGSVTPERTAARAVALAGALYDALPPDPDQEQGGGAPAELDIPPLPAEQHPCHASQEAAVWRRWHERITTSPGLWRESTTNPKEWPNGTGLQAECRGCGSTLMARWAGAAQELLPAEPEDTRPGRPFTRVEAVRLARRLHVAASCDPGPADPVQP